MNPTNTTDQDNLLVCWSSKGGVGTTVVACSIALTEAVKRPCVIVDLCGDVPAALGLPEPSGPGVRDWLLSPDADAGALGRLLIEAKDGLRVLPVGAAPAHESGRWQELLTALRSLGCYVVVDAGLSPAIRPDLLDGAHSLLVTRACYLGLRRVIAAGIRPDGIVMVVESGRALTSSDVARAVGAPVVAEVPWSPAVARAVDAGMLASRQPAVLKQALAIRKEVA